MSSFRSSNRAGLYRLSSPSLLLFLLSRVIGGPIISSISILGEYEVILSVIPSELDSAFGPDAPNKPLISSNYLEAGVFQGRFSYPIRGVG